MAVARAVSLCLLENHCRRRTVAAMLVALLLDLVGSETIVMVDGKLVKNGIGRLGKSVLHGSESNRMELACFRWLDGEGKGTPGKTQGTRAGWKTASGTLAVNSMDR